MKQASRLDDWSNFINYEKQRINLKLSPILQAMMDNCQYVLHTQFDKNTKAKHKHKKRKNQLTEQYRQAFKSLNRDQKLAYYLRYMKLITSYFQGVDCTPVQLKGMFSSDVYSRSYNLKIWKHKKLRLDRQKHIMYAEKDNKIKTYVLEDYLIRRSKNKQYYTFVLEAVNNKPHQKSRTVHLGFKQQSKYNQWFRELLIIFDVIQWNFIVSQMKNRGIKSMTQSQQLGRSSQITSQRSKITDMNQDQSSSSMSKSSIVDLGNKSQVVSKYQDSFNQSFDGIINGKQKQQQFFSGEEDNQKQPNKSPILKNRQTIIQSIAKIDDMDEIQEITKQEEKKVITNEAKQNIFQRIMPEYKLDQIQKTINFGSLYSDQNMRILGHLEQPLKIKMFINLPSQFSLSLILKALTDSNSFKQWNQQVQEMSLKTLIKSQNSAMMYLKIKAYNKLYRPRDFIFLRHVFSAHQTLYLVDKSIQNVSFPPFTTIVRGELCILWAIKKQAQKNIVIADINMNNQGYLNDAQNVNLVLKYLKGFTNLGKNIKSKKSTLQNFNLFYQKWNIVNQYELYEEQQNVTQKKKQQKQKRQKKQSFDLKQQKSNVDFKKKKTQSMQQVKDNQTNSPKKQIQIPQNKQQMRKKSVDNSNKLLEKYSHMEQQKGQVDLKQIENNQKLRQMTVHGIKRDFDSQGMVIVSNSFVKTKYILAPLPKKQLVFQEAIEGHPIWKGEWIHDEKVGSIKFINEKKIQDQKGVLKFILTKIGKNILSGKSVLNISLPVDIFCAQSNLQRLIYSLTYAPTHLQPAVKDKNPLQRLKKIIAFGISNSPLYLNMEKPFNPILGQTFQCWIDGCPAYAEQISHHPPIAAILYQGRGFRMTAQLQSKVQLHMNSGCGTNDGVFKIKFQDGMQGCYVTPGGEVSGLTYGDRKFNMVGKSYYWIQSQGLFLELVFNPARKGFFSVGKQQQPIDYLEGYVCKVKQQFMQQFHKKRRAPTQKQIIQKYGKVHGIWNKTVFYENQIILDIDKEFPVKLQYQANPLPSDANWREDIAYRRIIEISRSQTQKQRLQVLQRKDRKLRESNPNHHHHHKK